MFIRNEKTYRQQIVVAISESERVLTMSEVWIQLIGTKISTMVPYGTIVIIYYTIIVYTIISWIYRSIVVHVINTHLDMS